MTTFRTSREIAYEIDKELDPEAFTPQAIIGRALAETIDRQIRAGKYVSHAQCDAMAERINQCAPPNWQHYYICVEVPK